MALDDLVTRVFTIQDKRLLSSIRKDFSYPRSFIMVDYMNANTYSWIHLKNNSLRVKIQAKILYLGFPSCKFTPDLPICIMDVRASPAATFISVFGCKWACACTPSGLKWCSNFAEGYLCCLLMQLVRHRFVESFKRFLKCDESIGSSPTVYWDYFLM